MVDNRHLRRIADDEGRVVGVSQAGDLGGCQLGRRSQLLTIDNAGLRPMNWKQKQKHLKSEAKHYFEKIVHTFENMNVLQSIN